MLINLRGILSPAKTERENILTYETIQFLHIYIYWTSLPVNFNYCLYPRLIFCVNSLTTLLCFKRNLGGVGKETMKRKSFFVEFTLRFSKELHVLGGLFSFHLSFGYSNRGMCHYCACRHDLAIATNWSPCIRPC